MPKPTHSPNPNRDGALMQAIQWGVAHGAFDTRLSQRCLRALLRGDDDPDILDVVQRAIRRRQKIELDPKRRFNTPPASSTQSSITFELAHEPGLVSFPQRFSHGVVLAPTGFGKTTTAYAFAKQLAGDPKTTLTAIDMKDGSLACLQALYAEHRRELTVIDPKDLPLNIVRPDGMSAARATTLIPRVLARSTQMPPGAEVYLHQTHRQVLHEKEWPSGLDWLEVIRRSDTPFDLACLATLTRVVPLFEQLMPTMTRTERPIPTAHFRRHNVVLRLGELGHEAKTLTLTTLLYGLLADPTPPPGRHVILLDDCLEYLVADALGGGIGPTSAIFHLIRFQDVVLIAFIQTRAGVSPHVLSNATFRFVLGAATGADRRHAALDLDLRPDQLEALSHLQEGEALLQLPRQEACIVRIPPMPTVRIDEPAIAEGVRRLKGWPYTLSSQYGPNHVFDLRPIPRQKPAPKNSAKPGLSPKARALLQFIVANPGRGLNELARDTKQSKTTVQSRCAELLRHGYIQRRDEQDARGAPKQAHFATDAGRAAL